MVDSYLVLSTWLIHTPARIDCTMDNNRATNIQANLPSGEFILRLKFVRYGGNQWTVADKFATVRDSRGKGRGIITVSRDTKPGKLIGVN